MASAVGFKPRCVCAFSPVVIFRFTSDATPADCIDVIMVAVPFRSTILADHVSTSMGEGGSV